MSDFLSIACGAGLKDGLNPCIFMTCAVFIIYRLWTTPGAWVHIVFGLVYAFGVLIFNFGPGQIFVFQKNFMFASKIIYFILGLGAFVLGVLFFKDWVALRRGLTTESLGNAKEKPIALVVWLTAIILGIALSALATLWPVNNYIILLGNEALLKGQWQTATPLLVSYTFISMWPLWFVWAFLNIKNLRPSLLKIVCASVFFTASSSMILIFK